MKQQFTYTVTSDIHHGRLFRPGEPITLAETEAAGLSGYLDLSSKRDADPSAQPGKGAQDTVELTEAGQLVLELKTELKTHQEAMATLIEEHEADLQERDHAIGELTTERDKLQLDLEAVQKRNWDLDKALADAEAAEKKAAGQIEKFTAENKKLKDELTKAKGAQKAMA